MGWPLIAPAQASTAAPIRTIPDESFQHWVREDNKLIKSILGSLTHIDALLIDIERIIRQLPDPAVPPETARPAPPATPVVIEKTVIREVPGPAGPLAGWPPTLAGAVLLAGLAFWLGKRQPNAGKTLGRFRQPVAEAATDLPPKRSQTTPKQKQEPAPDSPGRPVAQFQQNETASADQTLELAEIMFSMGLGQGAAQTLIEQIRNEPKHALRHWLKLLEIYRRNGQQDEFERSAEELRLHFNVYPADWHAQPGTLRTLEDYPHIAKRLVELWGKPDCLVYIKNLLDDNRGGARSGFSQSITEELLLLSGIMRDG